MKLITKPIVNRIIDNEANLKKLENKLKENSNLKINKIIKDYPIVYIHSWMKKNKYEIYVGESNDIFSRTGQHYQKGKLKNCWQSNINNENSFLYIIGHEHFNKSLTLDLENKLIHYLTGVNSIRKVYNNKGNPQNEYYTRDEFELIFHKIWQELKKYDDNLFPIESKVIDSALFKSSPLHKLTTEQEEFKKAIIDKVIETLLLDQKGNLIFIEGDVGTGKTVLNCSTFYELCNKNILFDISENNSLSKKINCCMIVNHKEQRNVYKNIFKKLCVSEGKEIIYSPTRFINRYSKDNPIDVAFVDEAHLLLTQGKQSYTGKNQLQDILDRAKVVVIMFDYNQILSTEQYWEYNILEKYRKIALKNNSYKKLTKQLRIKANDEVINWIDDFTKKGIINKIPKNLGNYDIKVFDNPSYLEKEIKQKAKNTTTSLSRIVATYDWKYNDEKSNDGNFWEVTIGNWHKPWNYQLEKKLSKLEKEEIKDLSWSEQKQTINEVGSTFTIQGFDLNYVGVIIGPSVTFRDNKIVFRPECSCNDKAVRNRTLMDGTHKKFGEMLLRNELRILMTRGINGLYIYACDDELRKHLKKCAGKRYIKY